MSDETPTSAAEDLAYIRRVMEDTRRAVTIRGDYFILWGIAVLLGLIGTYVFDWVAPPGWAWAALWAGLMLIAWAGTGFLVRREVHRAQTSASVGRMLGALWSACGFAILIICFIGVPLGTLPFTAIGPTINTLIGVAVFVTGMLMGTPWVRNLGFGWWASAIAEFIWTDEKQILIGALAIILFYIVPGFVLNAQARKFQDVRRT
jgi:FtsH-binding integral membrane protein